MFIILPAISNPMNSRNAMISELVDSIEIFPIGFANTLLMFGSIKEEMRKYNPKKT
nr:hypothetical protein [Methanobrevibacter arboriphilus]